MGQDHRLTDQEFFDQAMRHHRAGRLHQAEQLYCRLLAHQPHHAAALHYLGVMAHQQGRNDVAVDLMPRTGKRGQYRESPIQSFRALHDLLCQLAQFGLQGVHVLVLKNLLAN